MKINLEKELIKANKKLATPEELLILTEYEKNGALLKDDSLKRVGLTQNLKKGNEIKTKAEKLKAETLKFDQSRVFHISQIKETCMKYYLRFLPSIHYKGTLDKELPFKINAFEAAYQVKCQCDRNEVGPIEFQFYIHIDPVTGNQELRNIFGSEMKTPIQNTFIMAPKSSFELQEVPKDPLFFYKINEEYYYLIHKWGNDLNIGRRVIGFFSDTMNCFWFLFLFSLTAFLLCALTFITSWITAILGTANLVFAIRLVVLYFCGDYEPLLKNNWNSPHKD